MICRYKLKSNGKVLRFGNECLKNWGEISYAAKRSDYGGVIRSFSSAFQFTGNAKDFVLGEYLTSYLNASTTISVYTINEDQSYSLLYKAKLDYGTMRIADHVLEINSFDDSIASIIKAKKSTKYEYPVSDIAETEKLYYDGMYIKNSVDFTCGGTATEIPGTTIINYVQGMAGIVLPMYFTEEDYMVKRSIIYKDSDFEDDIYDFQLISNDNFFIRCESSINIHLKFSFSMNVQPTFVQAGSHYVRLLKLAADGTYTVLKYFSNAFDETTTLGRSLYVSVDEVFALNTGDRLVIVCSVGFEKLSQTEGGLLFTGFSCNVTWVDRILPVSMPVVKPVTLLNSLLNSINESSATITGEIVSNGDTRLDNAMILASESARGITTAKLSTSFGDFCKWMEAVFGYVYVIEDSVVRFVHRSTLFDSSTEAQTMDGETNNVEFSVNDGLIYSSVKVGYKKEDYDTANGADEFRWTTEYDTGVNIKENALELMSPYRADAYGIEFLAEGASSGKATEIFFVGASLTSALRYELDRSTTVTEVAYPETMFNAMYSPRSFVEANKAYVAASTESLKFASSDGKSDVSIAGVKESDLFILGERLFSAGILTFNAVNGGEVDESVLIEISKDGRVYKGFMNERSCKYGQYDGVKYELLIKTIE